MPALRESDSLINRTDQLLSVGQAGSLRRIGNPALGRASIRTECYTIVDSGVFGRIPMERRKFLKNAGVASGLFTALPFSRSFGAPSDDRFPLLDLHCHLTPTFTIDQVMEISKKTGVQFGIMVNAGGAVSDDAGLRRFIDSLNGYPVYYGLQPMSPGWSSSFSPETIKLLDYVLMDPQTIPNGNRYGAAN